MENNKPDLLLLTVKEFDLLALLIKNRGNVLTRELLLEHIWDFSADVESRTIDVHIRTLRQKLGDAGNAIETIRGDGSVYFDNTVSFEKMENHELRSEFLGAKDKGVSKISRYSSTMTEKTLYFAKQLDNGDVLRISCNQHSVWVLVLGMSQILLLILMNH